MERGYQKNLSANTLRINEELGWKPKVKLEKGINNLAEWIYKKMDKYSVFLVSPFPKPYGGIASYSENLYKGLIKNINVYKYDTSRFDKYRFYKPDKTRTISEYLIHLT